MVCSKCIWGVWRSVHSQENLSIFTLIQAWKQHFQHFDKELLYKYEHFISFKTGNLILNRVPFSRLQTYRAWKIILIIWINIKSRKLKNSNFPNSLVNREQLGSTAFLLLNWDKLRSPARSTFKDKKNPHKNWGKRESTA